MKKKPFYCNCCGECCKLSHPEFLNGIWFAKVGRCSNLSSDNLCIIYNSRPEICKVKDNLDENKFFCKVLQEKSL